MANLGFLSWKNNWSGLGPQVEVSVCLVYGTCLLGPGPYEGRDLHGYRSLHPLFSQTVTLILQWFDATILNCVDYTTIMITSSLSNSFTCHYYNFGEPKAAIYLHPYVFKEPQKHPFVIPGETHRLTLTFSILLPPTTPPVTCSMSSHVVVDRLPLGEQKGKSTTQVV